MKNTNTLLKSIYAIACSSALALSLPSLADSEHNHGHENMGTPSSGQMMNQQQMSAEMGQHMREVIGHGRLNKIMADRHMVNINHEPIPQMDWPKMRMNFKTQEGVKLSDLKPGQEVTFTLLVDGNDYVIKEIKVK